MKRFSYRERDYSFGQAMLTLRTTIGLTQAGLADLLGVSRRAVGEWEAFTSRFFGKRGEVAQKASIGVETDFCC